MITLEKPIAATLIKEDVLAAVEKYCFLYIKEGKNLNSIWFKDSNDQFSVFINNKMYASYTLLATVDGTNVNFELTADEYIKFWNMHKIFLNKD